jgi:NADH dehydrogenase FAD-containing subunit
MVMNAPRPSRERAFERSRVAIVGGNFAGLTAARSLSRDFVVTVIDPGAWFEFIPNIHELVSGVKDPQSLRLPRRRLVEAAGHRFIQARVDEIDAKAGGIILESGRRIGFDVCIVAVGGVNDTFGVPGAARHALPFKSVSDCRALASRLEQLVRGAAGASVTVVGGGLEGVEALGEILRRYRSCGKLALRLVESGNRLLAGTPAAVDETLRGHCESLGVKVHLGSRVRRVTGKEVELESGRHLPSDLTIWTGGVTAPPLLARSRLAPAPVRWATVTDTLQSRRFGNVLVAGDAAELPAPVSKQAYYAMQMGECAGYSAARILRGQPPRVFTPVAKPMLVAFGDIDTFLVTGGSAVAGTVLAAAKETVFHLTMARFGPPVDSGFVAAIGHRGLLGIEKLLVGGASWDALVRLPRVRILH